MSQDYRYPNSAVSTVVLSSEGPNGDPAPADSIQVGGKDDSGDLQPLHVDAQGNLQVDVLTSPLPTNAATATNQVLQLAQETAISGKLPATLGQKASAASLAVVIASDQSAVPVSAASLPLPAGASTLSEQQTQTIYLLDIDSNTSDAAVTLASIDSKTPNLSSGRVPVDVQASVLPTGAATDTTLSAINAKVPNLGQAAMVASTPVVIASNQSAVPVSGSVTVSGTVAATQSGAWNITNISGTVSLPTGAATLAEQQTQSASLASIDGGIPAALGQTTMSASMPVTLASNQSALSVTPTATPAVTGRAKANAPTTNNYASVNVLTSAYVQLIASTTSTANLVEIFDSSGQSLILAVGGAGAEVDQFYISPGGNGQVPLAIPSGSRVSIKALSATASSGYILLNLYT